jgi:hypothetical protein
VHDELWQKTKILLDNPMLRHAMVFEDNPPSLEAHVNFVHGYTLKRMHEFWE